MAEGDRSSIPALWEQGGQMQASPGGLTRVVSQAPTLFPEGLGTCEGMCESTCPARCDCSASSSREKDWESGD